MKPTSFLPLLFLVVLAFSCDNEPVDFRLSDDESNVNTDVKWWLLFHPNYGNGGIYLYNETTAEIEKTFTLPDPEGSPHALDFDGESLWLGGYRPEKIYKLNPENGTVLSEINNVRTQGIVALNGELYYSTHGKIKRTTQDGTLIENIPISSIYPQDLAYYNSNLYYVDTDDPIIKVNPNNSNEEIAADPEVSASNTLTIHNNQFIVITNTNNLRRVDIDTGAIISDTELPLDGWITAIAPYRN